MSVRMQHIYFGRMKIFKIRMNLQITINMNEMEVNKDQRKPTIICNTL